MRCYLGFGFIWNLGFRLDFSGPAWSPVGCHYLKVVWNLLSLFRHFLCHPDSGPRTRRIQTFTLMNDYISGKLQTRKWIFNTLLETKRVYIEEQICLFCYLSSLAFCSLDKNNAVLNWSISYLYEDLSPVLHLVIPSYCRHHAREINLEQVHLKIDRKKWKVWNIFKISLYSPSDAHLCDGHISERLSSIIVRYLTIIRIGNFPKVWLLSVQDIMLRAELNSVFPCSNTI